MNPRMLTESLRFDRLTSVAYIYAEGWGARVRNQDMTSSVMTFLPSSSFHSFLYSVLQQDTSRKVKEPGLIASDFV